jgi:hypothetical protein
MLNSVADSASCSGRPGSTAGGAIARAGGLVGDISDPRNQRGTTKRLLAFPNFVHRREPRVLALDIADLFQTRCESASADGHAKSR